MENLNREIEQIISDMIKALNRPDLFRSPLVAFSSAEDPKYEELKKLVGEWNKAPVELMPEAKSVISYFVPFTKAVVESPSTDPALRALWGESYVIINSYFNDIGRAVSDFLASKGFASFLIAATYNYDPSDLKANWSHRSAAAVAGLGAFAANRLLITEKGSGGRFCSVLTSAPLEISKKAAVDRCTYNLNGGCGLCFKVCPAEALKPGSFDRFTCNRELLKPNEAKEIKKIADVCGKCISVCPFSYLE